MRAGVLASAFVVLLALAVRIASAGLPRAPDGAVRFGPDTDPYEHLRRVEHAIRHWPVVPFEYPDGNWPFGTRHVWPPLWDLVAATAARALLGPEIDRAALTRLLASLSLLVGVAGPLAAYGIGRRLGLPVLWAALGGAFLAYAPAHAVLTSYATFDHHGLEALCVAGLFAAHLVPPPRGAGLAAASLAALSLTWHGAWIYWVLVAVHAAGGALLSGDGAHLRRGAIAVGAAAAAVAPISFLGPWGREGAFTHYALSLFHPTLGLALLAGLGAAAAVRAPWRAALAAVAATAGTFLAGAALAGGAPGRVLEVIEIAFGRDPRFALVAEFSPTFGPEGYATYAVGLHMAAAPFGAALAGLPSAVFWSLATFGAAAAQRRFVIQYLPVAAPLLALLLREVLRRVPAGGRRAAAALALLVAVGASIWPGRRALAGIATERWWYGPVEAAAACIAARAAEAPDDVRRGVLVEWGIGHYVRTLTGLPVVSDATQSGVEDWYRVLAARSEAEALEILDARRVRFVVLTPPSPHVAALGRMFGDPLADRHADLLGARLWSTGRAESPRFRPICGDAAAPLRVFEILGLDER